MNYDDEVVLSKPTVGDLIKALSSFPESAPITIEDADTSWTIDIIHVHYAGTRVEMFGNYDEMTH